MKWWRSDRTFPLRIFLVSLVLRLIPVLATAGLGIGLDDMFQYDMLARSIAAGNGYRWYAQEDLPLIQQYIPLDLTSVDYDPRGVPTSFRPPLYPAFLALIYFLTGTGPGRFFVARLVQVPLGAAVAPLTFALGRRLFPERPRVAPIAAWLSACYPMLVIYPLSLATENLFFVLMLSSILALLKAGESGLDGPGLPATGARVARKWLERAGVAISRARWFLLAGFLLGLTALTRSVALGMAGLAILWIWFKLRKRTMALVTVGVIALVTLPWMVRNSILNHAPTGIESELGYNLYVGYHPQGTGTFQYPISIDLLPMLDDGKREAIGIEKALGFISADPARFPYLVLRRAGYFFSLERRALTYFYSNDFLGAAATPVLLGIAIIFCLPFVVISISSAFGLALVKWRTLMLLIGLILLGYITPHLFILGEDRFHLAIVPFLALLASFAWSGGVTAIRERWKAPGGRIAIGLACLAALLLLSNWALELWRDADKLALLFGPGGNQTYFSY